MNIFEREKELNHILSDALYLYFLLGLSFRDTSKAIQLPFIDRSYVAIWDWVQQRFDPKRIYPFKNKKRIDSCIPYR